MRLHHDFLWATLVHFSSNMWYDEGNTRCDRTCTWKSPAMPYLRFDRQTWDDYVNKMKADGLNCIVIDVGDSIIYDSHPELAIEGSFTKDEMRRELDRLNDLGFEVIPKLNFSATHDVWMKEYSRMVSTPKYYEVCRDLIDEVCELFEPRYFHIGFDEETYAHQAEYDYVTIRQNDLWWHDLCYIAECVEKNGARALVWADYARHRPDEFVAKLPKSVIPVNWYYFIKYGDNISEEMRIRVAPFEILEKNGFDQFPAGSVVYHKENMELLVRYCKEHISPEHLLGFMQTTWEAVEPKYAPLLTDGSEAIAAAKRIYEGKD